MSYCEDDDFIDDHSIKSRCLLLGFLLASTARCARLSLVVCFLKGEERCLLSLFFPEHSSPFGEVHSAIQLPQYTSFAILLIQSYSLDKSKHLGISAIVN